MKTCSACKVALPLSDFGASKKNPDGLSYKCRPCSRDYVNAHYARNREAYAEKARRWEAKRQAAIQAAKARPCADCGGSFHYSAMDFDHLPGGEKDFSVSAGRKMSIARVDAEIAKCEVVCANCHRVRTWRRRTA